MKEKVNIINQYGFHAQVTHNVYDFTDSKSWIDKAIEFGTWSGILAIFVLVALLFV